MKMLVWICTLLSLNTAAATSAAATTSEGFEKQYQIAADSNLLHFSSDMYNNLYLLYRSGRIEKYGPDGNRLAANEFSSFGLASVLDASNPLKIGVFFPSAQQLLFLDNALSQSAALDLLALNYAQTSSICLSADAQLWIFESSLQRLIKLNRSGTKIFESQEMPLLVGNTVSAKQLLCTNNLLFLRDGMSAVHLFDAYGTYLKTWSVDQGNWTQAGVKGNDFYYVENGKVFIKRLDGIAYNLLLPDVSGIQAISFGRDRLWLRTKDAILSYKVGS